MQKKELQAEIATLIKEKKVVHDKVEEVNARENESQEKPQENCNKHQQQLQKMTVLVLTLPSQGGQQRLLWKTNNEFVVGKTRSRNKANTAMSMRLQSQQ